MDLTYNNKTPSDVDAWLATLPIRTHSDIKSDEFDIPLRDGILFGESYRGNAMWEAMFHLKNENLDIKKRKVRQWLSGSGILKMSDTPDSYYEVKRVIITDDYRKSMEYGRIKAQFIVYPYEFLLSGDEGISGGGTIENEHDASMPLYKIQGNGSGTLSVNNHGMTFTVSGTLYIDTRRFLAYDANNNNKNGVLSGDYEGLRFITGDNIVSITSGFTLTTYPRWGYRI